MGNSSIARVRSNGQVTVPADLRRAAALEEGDALELLLEKDGSISMKPVVVMDRLQADLLLRLRVPQELRAAGIHERVRKLAPALRADATSDLARLVQAFAEGRMSRRTFIGNAIAKGLPPSGITALLSHAPERGRSTGQRDEDGEPGASQRSGRVRISQAFHALLYLPLYIAHDLGFFDDQGVSVEITTAGGGRQAWADVLSGEADYSIHDPVFAASSYEAGAEGSVVVASICNGEAIMALAADAGIKATDDPRDFVTETLNRRTVVTQPKPDSQWAVLSYLAFLYGVEMGTHFGNLEVPIGTEPEALRNGMGDLATAFPPAADVGTSRGLHEVFDFSRFFGPFLLSALCTRRSFIQRRRADHEAVVTALERAVQYAYAFPAESVKVAQREFPRHDPTVIAQAVQRCLRRHFVPEHVYIDSEAWRESQIVHRFAGTLADCHDVVELVDNDAALHAYRSLGHLAMDRTEPRPLRAVVSA